jgi:uncharacterized RDD family membrane protein YckC
MTGAHVSTREPARPRPRASMPLRHLVPGSAAIPIPAPVVGSTGLPLTAPTFRDDRERARAVLATRLCHDDGIGLTVRDAAARAATTRRCRTLPRVAPSFVSLNALQHNENVGSIDGHRLVR